MFNKIKINSCDNCINCNSKNVHLKCKDQTPWKKLLIPEEIDSAIDNVNIIIIIKFVGTCIFLIIILYSVVIKNNRSLHSKLV